MTAATPYVSGQNDASCIPGTFNTDARTDILRIVNLFRYYAGNLLIYPIRL